MQYIGLVGIMVLFVVALSNSKFGGNLKFDAEARPTVQEVEPTTAPPKTSVPEDFTFKCTREEAQKTEVMSTPVDKVYERKIQMR